MSSALFGSAARSSSKNLVEFRAGKMHLKNKMVHADKRKGLVYLYQSDDQLMHFCWKDRSTGAIEEDLIIFPDDCEYKRISKCTTGRAYVLIFRSSSRRLFFWMQEPKTEKDDDNCRKINDYMNNPPSHGSSRGGSSGGGSSGVGNAASSMLSGDLANLRDSDLQSLIGNISQQQLMQILSSGSNLGSLLSPTTSSGRSASSSTPTTASTPTPTEDKVPASSPSTAMDTSTSVVGAGAGRASTTTTPSASASTKSSDKEAEVIKLADLQNILTNIMTKDGTPGAGSSQSEGVDLSPVMNADALRPILANKDFLEKLKPYLPETGQQMPTSGLLRATVNSPQFKQAVSVFSQALQTGELGPLVQQFGLGQEAVVAAASGNMEAFLKALSNKQESSKEKKEEDDDDSMAVD